LPKRAAASRKSATVAPRTATGPPKFAPPPPIFEEAEVAVPLAAADADATNGGASAEWMAVVAAEPAAAAAPADVDDDSFRASDGLRLHYQVWRPAGTAKRLVMLVHGFADHLGRYTYLVPHLVEHGAVVYAYDQRGSGKSEGKRGHVRTYQRLVDDLETFLKLATEREPGLRRVLYAHSTGAIAALTYLYDHPDAVDAVVLSAPCLVLTFEAPGWKTALAKSINAVAPGFTMQAGFDPGTVSRDEQVVADNKADRLVTQAMTARFYSEVYLTAMPAAGARIEELKVPFLLLQGTADKLVSPAVADEFERRATAPGVIKRYEGGYHESHNEVQREEVFADVDAWLDSLDAGATTPSTNSTDDQAHTPTRKAGRRVTPRATTRRKAAVK
jgi:alpha-beta hydrolase superfamily lysophospholipase